MMPFYFDSTMLLLIPALIFSMWAQFRVKGDLRELPFRDPRQGEFRIAAQLRDVVYDYAPAGLLPAGSKPWPALEGLSGELVFERAGMRVRQARGRLAGLA